MKSNRPTEPTTTPRSEVAFTNRLTAAAALALANAVAHGQSTNAAGGPTVTNQLPEVLVTGQHDNYKPDAVALTKMPGPLLDAPQSVTVVPREVMDDQNTTTLRDALRNVAGISIAAGEGGSQGDNLTLRGFSARNDIFLDGMRDFGSYYRDPFNMEQVDVLKGPESVMFGRGSTGGVINQESKLPELHTFINGSVSLGTDLTRRATLDLNEPVTALGKNTSFRLNLMGTDAEVADRDVTENKRYGIAPSLAFGLGTDTRLTISYFHQMEDDLPDYGHPWYFDGAPPGVDRNNFYGFQSDYLKTSADIGTIKLEHDFNEKFTLRDQVRYAYYTRDFRTTEPKIGPTSTLGVNITNFPPANTLIVQRNELTGKSTETFFQNQMDGILNFNTGPIEHTLVGGVEVGQETSEPKRYAYTGVPTTSLVNPDEDQLFSFTSVSNSSDVDVTATSVGVYAVDSLKLNDYWSVMGGVRWDYFQSDYSNTSTNSQFPNGQKFSRTDLMTSGRAALVFKPRENGSIYFSYGTSFNPSAESLSLSSGTANAAPEENQTFELGTKWEILDHRLLLRAAVYQIDKSNARETDPANSLNVVLAGEQQVRGVEFEAAGRITENWQVYAGYAYQHSEVLKSKFFPLSEGYPLANAPEHTLTLWTTYDLPLNLEIGGGFKYISSRNASSTVPLDPTTHEVKQLDGYWTMDAMVKYRINRHWDVQANIYNLTDNHYYDQIHPAHIIPGAGLTAVFTANFRF